MTPDRAALIGGVIVALVSGFSVLLACMRSTVRFAKAKWLGRFVSLSDQLLAGIWVIGFGGFGLGCLTLWRQITGHFSPITALGFWLDFGYGHVLIFTAWRASYLGAKDAFLIPWIRVLLALGMISGIVAFVIAA